MPPIISYSERQRIESLPTQATGAHSHPCVSVAFKSSQPPNVPSLTPPPPRHYLRNATSSERLQGLIQKRSDIYTRVQQAQQEEVDGWHPPAQSQTHGESKVRPKVLTRSSSCSFVTSADRWKPQITRSASWKATGITLRRQGSTSSTKSTTEVHVVEFESLGARRRETMVLGLSEVDAHFRELFDSGDSIDVATPSSVNHAPFDPSRGELQYKGALGLTTTIIQIPVEIEMPIRDARLLNHEVIPELYRDVVNLNGDGTAVSYHAQRSHFAAPTPNHSSAPQEFTFPQRRRAKHARQSNEFPPPRKSSLVDDSPWLSPHASSSTVASVGSPTRAVPVESRTDIVDSHTRGKRGCRKNRSKKNGNCPISRAMRHLGDRFSSNGRTRAPELSGSH